MINTKVIITLAVSVVLSGCQLSDRFFGSTSESEQRKPQDASESVASQFEFRYSTQPDRSDSLALEQAALESQGEYYLFLDTTDQNAGSVQFYINGTVINSDNSYPYDLNGGSTLATAQDMGLFVLGTNRVSAKIKGKIVDEAEFQVSAVTGTEPTPEPEPEPEPEPDPEPEPEPEPTPTIDVTLYWNPPAARENGDLLATSEIGGYEIRYRPEGSTDDYSTVTIDDGNVDQYLFQGLDDTTYRFEIAAFDQDGLYSEFVAASY